MELGMTLCHLSAYTIYQNLLKGRRLTKPKTKRAFTPNTNERKWQQPQFQLHLITKSHGRWKLGLLISSAAIHLWKMMPRMMFWSIQFFFCEWHIYWTFPLVCVFVCVCVQRQTFVLLFLSAHFIIIDCQLHSNYSIILALCAQGYLYVFFVPLLQTTDTKYVIFHVGWRKSLKDNTTWY